MGDAVLRQEQVFVPVGLEVGVVAAALFVDLVLVGVDEIGVRVLENFVGDEVEGVLGKFVVVVQQDNKFTGGEFDGAIGARGNVAVLFTVVHLDARVSGRIFVEHLANVRCGRLVIGNAEFPVRIQLVDHRVEAQAEKFFRGGVDRHDHR